MSASTEPNPPARREEDFPKTNTIPDGWILDSLMDVYNSEGSAYDPAAQMEVKSAPVPTTGSNSGPTNGHNGHENCRSNESEHSSEPVEAPSAARTENENLFTRRLEPFPSVYGMVGMYL
ncbi:MAG: hypothetical protein EHM21_05235 [Chloroflexi bacterium]|nr:MAG: hypothetical protein EHM21_05235 [Chloroflexota bacterium]